MPERQRSGRCTPSASRVGLGFTRTLPSSCALCCGRVETALGDAKAERPSLVKLQQEEQQLLIIMLAQRQFPCMNVLAFMRQG